MINQHLIVNCYLNATDMDMYMVLYLYTFVVYRIIRNYNWLLNAHWLICLISNLHMSCMYGL